MSQHDQQRHQSEHQTTTLNPVSTENVIIRNQLDYGFPRSLATKHQDNILMQKETAHIEKSNTRSNSAAALKDRIVNKTQKAVPINSQIHNQEPAMHLHAESHSQQQWYYPEGGHLILQQPIKKPAIEYQSDIASNATRLDVLSSRIEACLNSSKNTLNQTVQLLSQYHKPTTIQNQSPTFKTQTSDLCDNNDDDDPPNTINYKMNYTTDYRPSPFSHQLFSHRAEAAKEVKETKESQKAEESKEVKEIIEIKGDKVLSEPNAYEVPVTEVPVNQEPVYHHLHYTEEDNSHGNRSAITERLITRNNDDQLNTSKVESTFKQSKDIHHPDTRSNHQDQIMTATPATNLLDAYSRDPADRNLKAYSELNPPRLRDENDRQSELFIQEFSHSVQAPIVHTVETIKEHHAHLSENLHLAGRNEQDMDEKPLTGHYLPIGHLPSGFAQKQSAELQRAIQENRNNLAVLEKLQLSHDKIALNSFKNSQINSPSKDTETPTKNSLRSNQESSDKGHSNQIGQSGISLSNNPNHSVENPSRNLSQTHKQQGVPKPKQSNNKVKNALEILKPLSPQRSRSGSPRTLSKSRSNDKIVQLEENFDKIHRSQKKNALSNSQNFEERMDKDIEFRHKKDKEFLEFVKQYKPKLSPQEKEELYLRLIEDAKEREMRKKQQLTEKDSSQGKAKVASENRGKEAWVERFEQDIKRRNLLKMEKEQLKEQEELKKQEEAKRNKMTKEIQESLVSRMMQDAVRRKASREKLLQAKIEQEMREAKENANKVFHLSQKHVKPRVYPDQQAKRIDITSDSSELKSPQKEVRQSKWTQSTTTTAGSPQNKRNIKTLETLHSPSSVSNRSMNLKTMGAQPSPQYETKKVHRERQLSANNMRKPPVLQPWEPQTMTTESNYKSVSSNRTEHGTGRPAGPKPSAAISKHSSAAEIKSTPQSTQKKSNEVVNQVNQTQKPPKTIPNKLVPKISIEATQQKTTKKSPSLNQSQEVKKHTAKTAADHESNPNFMTDKEAISYVNQLINKFRTKMLDG